jgi:hypothetical protein
LVSVLAAGLTGCGISTTTTEQEAITGARLQGRAYGGQTPLTGAAIYLYAVGTSGYGGAATSLLNPAIPGVSTDAQGLGYVTTDSNGAFSISNDYKCASTWWRRVAIRV